MFTPWAFGSTEDWAMRTANLGCYALGLLLLAKCLIRHRARWQAIRWRDSNGHDSAVTAALTWLLAFLTAGLLVLCFTSAINARATFSYETGAFEYHSSISWLPHSYDSASTWTACWNYLAWAALFWALRDWLLGKTEREVLRDLDPDVGSRSRTKGRFSERLERLLWVLSISGAVLALIGLIQQASGTNRLLWIRPTFYNRTAEAQFGPFPYRSNGAQYLNLIWPVALALWWSGQNAGRKRHDSRRHLLLPCVALMVVAPIMSLSRGGFIIAAGMAVVATGLILVGSLRRGDWRVIGGVSILLAGAAAGGWFIAGNVLKERLKQLEAGYVQREEMTEIGRKMAAEAPFFGTGPETLQPLYQLYKGSVEDYWPGQLHNDWLETRITFGWGGFGVILLALGAALARWPFGGGLPLSWRFVSFIWLAMAGCLVHARWDLPFQVYSITLLFLVYCCILLCAGRR